MREGANHIPPVKDSIVDKNELHYGVTLTEYNLWWNLEYS